MKHRHDEGSSGWMKVRFDLDKDRTSDDWPPVNVEGIWVTTESDGTFRLDNIPWYARGVSCNDVVSAFRGADDALWFERVLRRGGHSTYRVRAAPEVREADRPFARDILTTLWDFGCTAEHDDDGTLALDVPPGVPVAAVYDLLQLGEDEGIWVFEEGYAYREGDDPSPRESTGPSPNDSSESS